MAIVGTLFDDFPGGIAAVDCRGWDHLDPTTQTVPGIFSQVDAAYNTGKLIVFYNDTGNITGETDHFISSPISMKVVKYGTGYVAYSGTRLISDDDTVSTLT